MGCSFCLGHGPDRTCGRPGCPDDGPEYSPVRMTEAISPAQAAKNFSSQDLEAHIRDINAMLMQGGRTYDLRLIGDMPLTTEIMSTFERKGWRVSIVSDWRDGDFLQFRG
jgi:hypothetical protein